MIDPSTGEILAIASVPGYNPNDYGESEVDARRDRAVTDRFEPGSVMKVFTVAAALAGGTLKPTETIFCEHGTYPLGNVTIHDTHENDWLTPTQVLAKSSNIGALKIGLGARRAWALRARYRRFGFGEPTGLPLPGEASGVLRPKGAPVVRGRDGERVLRSGHQRHDGAARRRDGRRSRTAASSMEPILVKQDHRRARRRRQGVDAARAPRGRPGSRREDGRARCSPRSSRRAAPASRPR